MDLKTNITISDGDNLFWLEDSDSVKERKSQFLGILLKESCNLWLFMSKLRNSKMPAPEWQQEERVHFLSFTILQYPKLAVDGFFPGLL